MFLHALCHLGVAGTEREEKGGMGSDLVFNFLCNGSREKRL